MLDDSRTSTVACQLLLTDAVLRDGPPPAGLLPSAAAGRPLPLPLDGNVPPHSAGLAGDSDGRGRQFMITVADTQCARSVGLVCWPSQLHMSAVPSEFETVCVTKPETPF